jgi:hypothetical protein
MKTFVAVFAAVFVFVAAPARPAQAWGGHGGGHGGGHSGGHGGGHAGRFGAHGFHGGHGGGFDHGNLGHHPFVPGLGHRGLFRHHGGFGTFFDPFGGHALGFEHFPHGGLGGFFEPFGFHGGAPAVIIGDPFFCFPHGLGFAAQDPFYTHLWNEHGIPRRHAPAYLIETGARFIFLGF